MDSCRGAVGGNGKNREQVGQSIEAEAKRPKVTASAARAACYFKNRRSCCDSGNANIAHLEQNMAAAKLQLTRRLEED